MSPQPDIRRARPADLPAVLALLEGARLPTADIAGIDQPQIWVLEERGAIVGAIALERYGSEALMRSLVVAPEYRKRGFGRELVALVEESARQDRINQLVLLTETAEPLFRSLGYNTLDRRHVSERLRQSGEFRSLCPASATCLSKVLAPGEPS
jgi:amino-acid N-acetyltransferase